MVGTESLQSPITWFGGKGNMVDKLLEIVPEGGAPYCEPYCGGASLFWHRPPAPVEVLNDLDGDVVNLFRCLQDEGTFRILSHRIRHTLYSRAEFLRALEILGKPDASPLDRAWAFFVKQNQGFSGVGNSPGGWGRAFTANGGVSVVTNKWMMRLSMLEDWHKRLLAVQIDCVDALKCIRYWDNPEAVFYVDPPYHPATRKDKKVYKYEADEAHYDDLMEVLLSCKGAVVLSGYDNCVASRLEAAKWASVRFQTGCFAAVRRRGTRMSGTGAAVRESPRTEVVWLNEKARRACRAGFSAVI